MTIKRYLADPQLEGEVIVTEVRSEGRPSIRLAETPFHVQGGGQKADRGLIGGHDIYDVRTSEDGGIDHFVVDASQFEVGQTYPFAIDPGWRQLNATYHSAGHLLAAVCETMFPGMVAMQGHQWPGEARVDFKSSDGDPETCSRMVASRDAIEAAVRADIARAVAVSIVGDPFFNRACQIGAYAPVPCGGTHVGSAAEIGGFAIRSIKGKSDGVVRVGYELME